MDNWGTETKIDYLEKTREHLWNDDYFEFLVKTVWKIDKPVRILDIGCGYGYLGKKLLQLTPEGSTYTGLDCSQELLQIARQIYKEGNLSGEFIQEDLLKYNPQEKYDLVICQSVLRHIPEYSLVLQKMIDSAKPNGLVVCCEVNRRMENAGIFVDNGMDEIINRDSFFKDRWKQEVESGGRDYLAASKIPVLMDKAGLRDVSIRVNDYAEFISPNDKDYNEHLQAFCEGFMINNTSDNLYALGIRSMLISFGRK